MCSFVLETYLLINSTATRAKYNKGQARATLGHILQVRTLEISLRPAPLPPALLSYFSYSE